MWCYLEGPRLLIRVPVREKIWIRTVLIINIEAIPSHGRNPLCSLKLVNMLDVTDQAVRKQKISMIKSTNAIECRVFLWRKASHRPIQKEEQETSIVSRQAAHSHRHEEVDNDMVSHVVVVMLNRDTICATAYRR
jgi:hypothetical protein